MARHTHRLEDVVGFYRDGLGLPEIGRFEGHDGYDGVFLSVPGTDAAIVDSDSFQVILVARPWAAS